MPTIILPLSTGLAQARACIESIAALPDDPRHDVVVVDNGGADLNPLMRLLEGDVTVVRRPQRGHLWQAVNDGLDATAGDDVVLLTGMSVVDAGWLRALTAAASSPGVAAATSVDGDAPGLAPVASHAVAWRRAALPHVPEVPDGLVVAAVCSGLAGTGRVVSAPDSRVTPPGTHSAAARGGHTYGGAPELSVVIPTLDAAGDRLRACVASVQAATDVPHEIIIVDNGAPPQGFTAPVNAGLRAARGRYMVVCNDDVEVLPGWWAPLRAALDGGAAVTFPMTVDGVMREDFAAWCFALSRHTLETYGVAPGEFLDPEMVVWFQDTDLLFRLRAAGNPPLLVGDSHVRHGLSQTVASDDTALRAWIAEQVQRDRSVFEHRHNVTSPV